MHINLHGKFCVIGLLALLSTNANALYQCTNNNGKISFQDKPCSTEEEAKEITNVKESYPMNSKNKKELVARLAKSMGKAIDPNDPNMMQAIEAFLVADAAKAYAFTKVYGVSIEYCQNDQELVSAMNNFKSKAKDSIALGEIYYRDGYDLQVGSERINHTGKQLTDSLEEMLNDLRKDHQGSKLATQCKESIKALKSLAMLYGG